MKGTGLAIVAGLGALMFAGGGSGATAPKTPPKPKERPSEEAPPEITGRVAAALSTLDPRKIRAEADKLRKEGWDREADDLEAAAAKIEAGISNTTPETAPPKPAAPRDLLSEGMRGEDVRGWQQQLVKDGYTNVQPDGIFGPITVSATKSWQAERGLKPDGIVGPATQAKIGTKPTVKPAPAPGPAPATKPPTPAPASAPAGPRVLSQGMKGDDVKAWQRQLIADGYTHLAADGVYGPLTTEATKIWQAERGLKADGIVGPATRAAIGSPPIASVPGSPSSKAATPAAVLAPKPAPAPTPAAPAPAPKPSPVPVAQGPLVTVAPASAAPRLLKRGVQGDDVRVWQAQLVKDGFAVAVDGVFGEKTEAATLAWQRARNIAADGIVGPKTRAAIGKPAIVPPSVAQPPLTVDTSKWRTLKQGMTGPDVKEWQLVLNKYGALVVATDGNFGPKTHEATVAFQTVHGLVPDGIVGKGTRAKLDQLAGFPNIVAGELDAAPAEMHAPPPFERVESFAVVLGPDVLELPSTSPPAAEDASPEQLARQLVAHLEVATPGRENRELVQRFQRAVGLKSDTGVYGPGTAEAIASLGIVPPRPFDWPSKKAFRVKARYRATMREHARRDPDRANAWIHAGNV